MANTARGEAEYCICHETPPRVLYFIVQHEYTVLLLICWFCMRGLLVFSVVRRIVMGDTGNLKMIPIQYLQNLMIPIIFDKIS